MIHCLPSDASGEAFAAANRLSAVLVGECPTEAVLGELETHLHDPRVATVSLVAGRGVVRISGPVGSTIVARLGLVDVVGGTQRDVKQPCDALSAVNARSSSASERGFSHLAVGIGQSPAVGLVDADAHAIDEDQAAMATLLVDERTDLRVLFEGSCLIESMAGTQVHALALITALARHPALADVAVATPTPLPSAIAKRLADAGCRLLQCPENLDLSSLGSFDIVHRPVQAHGPLPYDSWRSVGSRVVMTVLDLIAYDIPGYHESPQRWQWYRDHFRRSVGCADAVMTISADVAGRVVAAGIAVDGARLFVVPSGLDHLKGTEPLRRPAAIEVDHSAFILMLGTGFAHKNHDLGVEAWSILRDRGCEIELVIGGASNEALSASGALVLGSISDDERNWLLANASVVLYPTSAEGLGFIPFEAAAFGTSTVSVAFGPLAELAPDLPVSAVGWHPAAFADAVERLLAGGDEQIAAYRAAAERFSWTDAADRAVTAYRTTLRAPSMGTVTVDSTISDRLGTLAAERDNAFARLDSLERSRAVRLARWLRRWST